MTSQNLDLDPDWDNFRLFPGLMAFKSLWALCESFKENRKPRNSRKKKDLHIDKQTDREPRSIQTY